MTSDLLGVSITGLRVSQAALRTTGHNIANVNTPGFSRQRIIANSNPGTYLGPGFIGNGANVTSIERITNDFLTRQVRSDTMLYHQMQAFNENITQLDRLVSDPATGLSEGLEQFFASLQNGADDPTSIPARQLIISESENLVNRFVTLYDRMAALNNGINDQLSAAVSNVNALADTVAILNTRISDGFSNSGTPPNDLMDQRDEALRQLSELVSIQTFEQGDGQVNVLIGSGQALVVGVEARRLSVVDGQLNAQNKDIAYQDEYGTQIITSAMEGGEIGGLIRFREQALDPAFNELGRVAIVLSETMNEIHQQGVDLNNQYGGFFFDDVNSLDSALSRAQGHRENLPPANQVLSVEIEDTTQLTASNYEIKVEPGTNLYRVYRLDDNVEVTTGILPTTFPASIEFDGVKVNFLSGTFQGGDRFMIQPTRHGARDIGAALVNPEDLAFGNPVLTDAALGNVGSGEISFGEVLSLEGADGNPLPLLSVPEQMNPPLIIKFTTPTTYDVLDNSDPGNPVQLTPPLRNQTFIPGISNDLFTQDKNETLVTTTGVLVGLPSGRAAVTQAALQTPSPPATAPAFGVSNFSAGTDQFAFDIVVSNTLSGANDGTFTVTINEPAITSNSALLTAINNDLSGTDVRAYIDDSGNLGFRLLTPGLGNITVQNYDPDPDGGATNAPAGQANTLFGFDIEGSTFTTVANANGVSGTGVMSNGYPTEVVTYTRTDPVTGAVTTENVVIAQNSSAKQIANQLNNVPGVNANARNAIEISNLQLTHTEPLQITLNGEDLLEYVVISPNPPALNSTVPDPAVDPVGFNDYLAARINENANLSSAGIHAVSGTDPVTGKIELRIFSTQGDDLQVELEAAAGETLDVSDTSSNPNVVLTGAGNSSKSTIIVGGQLDVTLSENVTMGTWPPVSLLFGDSTSANYAQSTYLGIQASINGTPATGDTFTIDFNENAAQDNRNALDIVDMQQTKTIEGSASYADGYGKLIEEIGIITSESIINTAAAEQVLEQSTNLRNSIAGVNLDEEAAELIRFEQIYSANAQAIAIARSLFDQLINSF